MSANDSESPLAKVGHRQAPNNQKPLHSRAEAFGFYTPQFLREFPMRVVIQRVSQAAVTVDQQIVGKINAGLLVLAGFETSDTEADLDWMAAKIVKMRLFADEAGVMNRSVVDCDGEILAVSQFTLFASVKKGTRPSWSRAARGEVSGPLFAQFVAKLTAALGKPVATGVFGADMQVALVNDGPVTIVVDSKSPD